MHDNQIVETTQMSINKQIGKSIVAHLYNWIVLLSNKNEHNSITYSNECESQSHYAEQKQTHTKEHILVGIIYMKTENRW